MKLLNPTCRLNGTTLIAEAFPSNPLVFFPLFGDGQGEAAMFLQTASHMVSHMAQLHAKEELALVKVKKSAVLLLFQFGPTGAPLLGSEFLPSERG